MNTIHSNNALDMAVFNRIAINLYPLFIAIFEHKNISQSAQILCISQSAASHALQRLRSHLKNDLFVRATTKMLPTPFEEQIYPILKNTLLAIETISFQKQEFEARLINNIKIAIPAEIEPIIFPKLVQHLQNINLDIQFLGIKLDRKTLFADFASQHIDFFIDLEQKLDEKIPFLRLLQDYFMVSTQRSTQSLTMDADVYLSSTHIGVSSRRAGVLLEDIDLKRKPLSRQFFLRCQHYSTAM